MSAHYIKDATDPQWKNDPAFKVWDEWMKKYHKGADRWMASTPTATPRRRPSCTC